MKTIFYILLLSVSSVYSNVVQPEEVRRRFNLAVKSEEEALWLKKNLSGITVKQSPLLYAYRGASIVLLANYTYNPVSKLSYVKQGIPMLNESVKEKPEDAEIRVLRFSIEDHMPSVLGYSTHLKEDLKVLLGFIKNKDHHQKDKSLCKDICKVILEANSPGNDEKNQVKPILTLLK